MRHRLAILALPLSLSLFAGHAHADDSIDTSQTTTEATPSAPALRLDVGLFSPVGSLGVVYSRPVHRFAAVELGAGLGFSGVQLSGMVKARVGSERTKFTPGVGLSLGLPILTAVHEGHPMNDDEMRGSPVSMAWLDVDLLGVEHRTRSGLVLSASGGLTVALTEGHWDAADLGNNIKPLDVLPQFRLGVGKTF
jgi:hypothetical protein